MPQPLSSPSLPITLLFQISSLSAKKPVPGDVINITDDRARQFLNVGIARISRDYNMSPNNWTVTIAPLPNSKDVIGVLGVATPTATAGRDRKMTATIQSPLSPAVLPGRASRNAAALMATDYAYSGKREYRVTFTAAVVATYRPEVPKSLFFDITMQALLDGKSAYADDESYKRVTSFNQQAAEYWQREVSDELFRAYIAAFRDLGLRVEPRSATE